MFIEKAESILNKSRKKVNTRYNSTKKLNLINSPKSSVIKNYSKESYKAFKSSSSYKKIKGIVSKKKEVVVKVTGYSKGAKSVKNNLLYVSRNYEIEIYNDKDQLINDKEEMKEYFNDFISNSQRRRPRENSRDTVHLSLSFPDASNEQLLNAVDSFAKDNFKDHEYLYALHDEEKGLPHVHLIVQTRSKNLKKTLRINKPELEYFRESFSEKINSLGLESNSTSRVARMKFQKPKKQIEYHSKEDKINLYHLKGVRDIIENKKNEKLDTAKEFYKKTKKEWEELSNEIKKHDKEFSDEINNYINSISFESRQEALTKEVIDKFNEKKEKNKNEHKDKDIDIEI